MTYLIGDAGSTSDIAELKKSDSGKLFIEENVDGAFFQMFGQEAIAHLKTHQVGEHNQPLIDGVVRHLEDELDAE